MPSGESYIQSIMDIVKSRNVGEPEFLQAVAEVLESLLPVMDQSPKYRENKVLERIVEPELAPMSTPVCSLYTPRMGWYLIPY